ncbi:hypothetical protein SBDP1_610077 [Syntrophobacter sp. SbD1]|nr:hypothetical protein SBDP1_610077 [Syntrophobacter sp. SbD1]
MSYILDALKKSEQARRGRKGRGLLQGPIEAPVAPPKIAKSSRGRLCFIAVILFINIGFFAYLLRPWQGGGNAGTGHAPPPETKEQSAQVIAPSPSVQLQAKHEPAETMPAEQEKSPPGPTISEEGRAAPSESPATGTQTPDRIQDQVAEIKSKRGVAGKPAAVKPPQDPKTAATIKEMKTASLHEARKNSSMHSEQPVRPAGGSGILADMEPLTDLSGAQGEHAAARVLKWHELAPQIRDSIPNLSVSMLIYSKEPGERWININGSKRHEGDKISEGLKLEEITTDGAILSYQGRRFYKGVVGN